jgi:DNA repair exonuclease SbcCD ATPase subunit
MSKVSLQKLTIQNFRSFDGNHIIDFDETGLYLVRGYNHDTRGESGAGKSSIFLAIAYALDYCPYAATDLRCYLNEDPMYVELELQTEKGLAVIHRGDKLWLKYEGKKITSAKTVGEKLDEICGMNKRLREAITYRKQRSFGLFLSKKDSQKKEFLVELLGLQWLEALIEEAVTKVGEAKKKETGHSAVMDLHDRLVLEANENIPKEEIIDTSDLELNIETEISNLQKLAAARPALEKAVGEYKSAPFIFDSSEIDRLDNLLMQCRARIQRLGNPEMLVQRAQREIFRLQKEVANLFDDKCPRCERQWDKAKASMEQNQEEIQKHEIRLKEAEEALRKLSLMKETEQKIVRELDSMKNELRLAEISHIESINRLSESKRKDLAAMDNIACLMGDRLNGLRLDLSIKKNRNESNARIVKQAKNALMSAILKRDEAKKTHDQFKVETAQETDLLEMLRGFLGQIFGEVLQEISDETNRIIANLPNASKMTIQFETDRETQDGKLRNEITPVAYFGGRSWPLEAGASGGMFTSVELAVDLAVSNVIARRTGIDLGWLILDEAFANGSDKVTKEGCLEILKQYSANKLIIVVEHASEFKEFFSKVIEIDYRNERSRIK